jgi:hypothetical protein
MHVTCQFNAFWFHFNHVTNNYINSQLYLHIESTPVAQKYPEKDRHASTSEADCIEEEVVSKGFKVIKSALVCKYDSLPTSLQLSGFLLNAYKCNDSFPHC